MSTTTNKPPATPTAPMKPAPTGGVLTTVNDLLEKYKKNIEAAIPRHMTAERMIRIALTAVSQSTLLQKCSPLTICGAVVQASILGLEPNSTLGECFLIPYWSTKSRGYECQLQVGYKGLVKLARNSGEIAMVDAQPVCENDEKGNEPFLKHKWNKTGSRGAIIGYWAGFKTKDSTFSFEYWPLDAIHDHRDQYSQGAYKKERGEFLHDGNGQRILTGPWKDSPDWMCRKTVLIQALKLAPKSIQVASAVNLDELSTAGVRQPFTVEVPLELNPPSDEDDPHANEEPLQEPKRKIAEATAPAADATTTKAPEEAASVAAQQICFDNWEEVESKHKGDQISPSLGLRIAVGKDEFCRESTDQTWTKAKVRTK